MGAQTKIQWTQRTWNPWQGCRKVSPGCKYCYMYRDKQRYGQDPMTVVRSAPVTFNAPLRWPTPNLVFTCSWSDWFIEEADGWRADAWDIVRRTPHLTYQILTKRPERILSHLPPDWGQGWPNVWLGVSAENQATANERIPLLVQVPAAVRWVSAEPLIGSVDLEPWTDSTPGLDWVVVGGESGPQARPMFAAWALSLLEQCQAAGVPVFLKQAGEVLARDWGCRDRLGGNPDEWPEAFRVRQYPKGGQYGPA